MLDPGESLDNQEVTTAILLRLLGRNAAGESIVNQMAWTYDLTNCDIEPIGEGDKMGWIEVVEYTRANPAFCSAIETDPPTSTPSLSPTDLPTSNPIPAPTTAEPTISPTKDTQVETDSPTPSPVAGSMSYSASFSLAHTSKASKGKTGKSKSGKLIRERS